MVKSKKNIEERIELTIQALDDIKKVSPMPYLYTRIIARMNNAKNDKFYISPFLRYATIGSIIIVIFFNVLTITQFLGPSSVSEAADMGLEEISKEYYSEIITIDNLENYINE